MEKGISVAATTDIPQIVRLLNSAYRGEESKAGWSTEADLLDALMQAARQAAEEMKNKKNDKDKA